MGIVHFQKELEEIAIFIIKNDIKVNKLLNFLVLR